MGIPLPLRGIQVHPFGGARGQMPLVREGRTIVQHKEAMHVAFFTNYMSVHPNPN